MNYCILGILLASVCTALQAKGEDPKKLSSDDLSVKEIDSFFEYSSEIPRKNYEIILKNVPSVIEKEFEKLSVLRRDQKAGLVSEKEALKKAKNDRRILKQLFLQRGYFDSKVKLQIDMNAGTFAQIRFLCDPGNRYKISQRDLKLGKVAFDPDKVRKKIFGTEYTDVDFEQIENERKNLQKFFKQRGYFFTTIDPPIIDIDKTTQKAKLIYTAIPDKQAIVSNVSVSGFKNVPQKFILNRATFRKGTLLTLREIEISKANLIESGLFSNVNILVSKGKKQGNQREAGVNIDVLEILPRKISVGANYSDSEGASVLASWQHKNFLKKAHDIGCVAHVGTKEMSSSVFYNVPDILHRNQKLHMEITARHYDTKAFGGEKIFTNIGVVQSWRLGAYEIEGALLPTVEHGKLRREISEWKEIKREGFEPETINKNSKFEKVKKNSEKVNENPVYKEVKHKSSYKQTLGGFKSNFKFNFANHKLYPTKGAVLNFGFDQYFGRFGRVVANSSNDKHEEFEINKDVHTLSIFTGTVTSYLPLSRKERYEQNSPVLAVFLKTGGTCIKDLEYVPYDKRFYGGGRNSIRSYGYQMSGELEEDGTPIGAASMFEACIEPRIRISQDFGVVAFFDYSCLSDNKFPKFHKKADIFPDGSEKDYVRKGCGIGLRYFTQFGPIRLDFAFPFKRRKDRRPKNLQGKHKKKLDNRLQFYISVGQAF